MAWVVAGVLGMLLILFFKLYWRSLDESRQLVNLLSMVLLSEKVYDAQRKSLTDFITASKAKNAADLATEVNLSMTNLAVKLRDNTLGVVGILWQTKITAANK